MKPDVREKNGRIIAVLHENSALFSDGQGALDFMMTLHWETGARRIAMPLACLPGAFFDLSGGTAGDILQKFINYRIKLAVWGDFSAFAGKAFRALIAEANRGNDIFFCADEESAVRKLGGAP